MMRRSILVAILLASIALASPALAQTCPTTNNATPGFVAGGSVFGFLSSQWNAFFGAKADANNGTLCNPTLVNPSYTFGPAPPPYLYVTTYGAQGDGIFDNTTAFQNAFNVAATNLQAVFIPSGTWRFTGTLHAGNITILCQGNNNTFLVFDDGSTVGDGIQVGHSSFNMSGCNYDRKQAGTAGALLHLTDSYQVSVFNNEFPGPNAFNVVTIDSATHEPNTISVHDNLASNWINDFAFLNSQNASYPVYTDYFENNKLTSAGHAFYELAGYGQINVTGGFATGGPTYSLYIHTVFDPSVNTLSYIKNVDFDNGLMSISNFNGIHLVGNRIGSPITLVNDTGVEFMSNYMPCGSNTCPILMQGVVGLDWAANSITGQNNPITIEPNGGTASQDLNFSGSWRYGTGSFLTFSGSPVADNVKASVVLQGAETLANFGSQPTNFRNSGDSSGPSAPPTVECCSASNCCMRSCKARMR